MENRIEIWKPVVGYEGLYEVSSFGRVRSLDRYDGRAYKRGCILKPKIQSNYLRVSLCNGGKCKQQSIHRLVAQAFIPNPNNLPMVNHKDENKANNMVWINEDGSIDYDKSNLEWCDYSYNTSYSNKGIDRRNEKGKVPNFRIVLKLTLEGIEVGRYNGVREACEKNGYKRGRLDSVLYNSNSRIFDNFIWVLV